MRALTVRQPAAWAIFHAGKDIENRSWQNRGSNQQIDTDVEKLGQLLGLTLADRSPA